MSLYIPRLSRATSDYLQLASREAVAALEVIEVTNGNFTVEQFEILFRFRPSSDTISSISQFCSCALNTFGTGAAHERKELQRSLHFLQSLVDQVSSDSPSISASCQNSDDSNSSLRPSVSLTRARSWESSTPNGLHDSENGGDPISSTTTGGGGGGGGLQSNPYSSSRIGNSLGGVSSLSSENISNSVRRTRTPVLVDPSTPARKIETTLKGMWSSSMLSGLPSGGGTGEFQIHRRSRSDSLADKFTQEMLNFRPPQIWMNHGLNKNTSETEGESWLTVANMKGLMCIEHLWTVIDHQNGLSISENRRSASYLLGSAPLFQYKSYREQGRLDLDSGVISVILDTVCGAVHSNEASFWGEAQLADLWESSSGSKSIGEACVTILVKLIMDMYLKKGPGLSYVLVLQMLHNSLLNPLASVRIRAFDFVYNLALHSTMMSNTPDDSLFQRKVHEQTVERRRDQSNRNSRDLERSAIPKLHTLEEETEPNPEQESVFEMIPWVRSLLFDLMVIITELDEQDKQVWTAAIGCFLHLTTNNGEFLLCTVQNLPFTVIKQILKKCVENGWCDEIYVQFVRLFVCLVYDLYEKGERLVNEVKFLQGGGIEELLFHLHHTRSTEAATWLLQLLIDYISQTSNCNQEALSPLLSHLMSPSAVDVIVSQCRYGSKGIGDTFHAVLQNCITEKNTSQDSPKNPVHHRHKTQSSFPSSDTTGSLATGLDPEALEAWKSVLSKIDSVLCHQSASKTDLLQHMEATETSSEINWNYLKEALTDPDHQTRLASIQWIRDHCMAQLDGFLQQEEDPVGVITLLPPPSSSQDNELAKVLENWLLPNEEGSNLETGFELSQLIDEFISSLVNLHHLDKQQSDTNTSSSWTRVRKLGTILFQTLQSGFSWIKILPASLRRLPLVSIGYHICQLVRAPQIYSDVSSTPQSDGVACLPGPFVYNDYIFGTSAVYIHLLRLAPIDFLLELISELKEYCPVYNMEECVDGVGFFGRPGHRQLMRSAQGSMPWTDTISDIRSALTLLLLHRCSMDSKGTKRLESICRSLLEDEDVRVQYLASRYLLKHVMEEKSSACRTALRQFVVKAQQMNNERLVDNPYLQVKHILESEEK
eukprot:g1931.t1